MVKSEKHSSIVETKTEIYANLIGFMLKLKWPLPLQMFWWQWWFGFTQNVFRFICSLTFFFSLFFLFLSSSGGRRRCRRCVLLSFRWLEISNSNGIKTNSSLHCVVSVVSLTMIRWHESKNKPFYSDRSVWFSFVCKCKRFFLLLLRLLCLLPSLRLYFSVSMLRI